MIMNQALWADLSVSEFFSGYNWQGLPPQLESLSTPDNQGKSSSWVNLSVAEFLQRCHWQGQPLTKTEPTPPTLSLSLTLSVREYFQRFPWTKKSNLVQPMPPVRESAAKEPLIAASPELKLTDLSDLF